MYGDCVDIQEITYKQTDLLKFYLRTNNRNEG